MLFYDISEQSSQRDTASCHLLCKSLYWYRQKASHSNHIAELLLCVYSKIKQNKSLKTVIYKTREKKSDQPTKSLKN